MSALYDRFTSAPDDRIQRLERRLKREHKARLDAEAIAEAGLRALYSSQRRLALLQKVTVAANSPGGLRQSFHAALEEICTDLDLVCGIAYTVVNGGETARAIDLWFSAEPSRLFDFIELSRDAEFRLGEGLPGRVLADGQAHVLDETPDDEELPSGSLAFTSGLGSGFAFPITLAGETVAIFEFFCRRYVLLDTDLRDLLQQIGIQLGRVVERERSRQVLVHEARHDALTGLPNRIALLERISAAANARSEDALVKIMVVDLDELKRVNDLMGHSAGDQLIKHAARRLEDCVLSRQRLMTASEGSSCVSRVGGDEFIILLEGRAWIDQAKDLAAQMHQALAQPEGLPAGVSRIKASIGIARLEGAGDLEQLVRNADVAMYAAKERGGAITVEFDDSMRDTFRFRHELEQELREAIRTRQFVLNFQPIVEAADPNVIVGFEALVRWKHPQRGLIHPAEFIPTAESCGLILYLGDWVLEEACSAISRLNARGGRWADRYVAVNVAARQFLSASFSARVGELIMRKGIDPKNLRLEVTEGAAITDARRTREVLEQIRRWGVKTSLDDFGTGYSSLSYLQQLPFDTLKIDKSFVANAGETRSAQIVRTIVELARSLDLSVVAEGIENASQGKRLASLGCDYLQGYHYGHPLTESEAFARL
ncbi:putative bifunctional diguanylate cyclase/phosphodiesterase [Aurantiacibacter xanthus]|uniref:putative bifunctional diguanylate cyclase/phosphodiesterase n=1 Tax=Aurantiacibacter xanthus TaxID=1784712 RepID=UPI001FE37781|nr:bifunctional diguanylate cyclase/phosphodiesterase [Aurantiacibacter xanthus]